MRRPEIYFDRYAYPKPLTSDIPNETLYLSVIIPCHNEPTILTTLKALKNCNPTKYPVEVILIINNGFASDVKTSITNQKTYELVKEWSGMNSSPQKQFLSFYVDNIPLKEAGVGLARKIGMDEACRRFQRIGKEGVLVCLDADCGCDPNYLAQIEDFFLENETASGASVYFEHPVENEISDLGIILYELHLRYYVQALRSAGFPYAFHTVGSSMAVRSQVYRIVGGMNKRKAGEDFYFLNKVFQQGGYTEINNTVVYPSSRLSNRVPFGTGKAMVDWHQNRVMNTYNLQSFILLSEFLIHITSWLKGDTHKLNTSDHCFKPVLEFGLEAFLNKLELNTSDQISRVKYFFRWFDNFKAMKYLHWWRDHFYPDLPVIEAVNNFLKEYFQQEETDRPLKLLQYLRQIDRQGIQSKSKRSFTPR